MSTAAFRSPIKGGGALSLAIVLALTLGSTGGLGAHAYSPLLLHTPHGTGGLAQITTAFDTLPPGSPAVNAEDLPESFDGLTVTRPDSLPPRYSGNTAQFQLSPDSLTATVNYAAEDSMEVDFITEEIHLWGSATVDYEDIKLNANHIVLNYGTNEVFAEPLPDSAGVASGIPEFSDGGQAFTARRMRYNFKSQKGIVYGTTTTQDDIFVRGGKSKFISGAVAVDDTTRADVIYTQEAIFTTCSAEHPHFGIRARKAKVVPNKLAVIGPSNLEIMGVPTPLWLPFGFFPLKSGRSTGLLFPSDYQYNPNWGFGLQGVGWFFPVGEHLNLQLTADYYLRGTYSINTNARYVRRYKYSGSFNASFRNLRVEDRELNVTRDKGITLRWSHQQDKRAHPTFSFGGNINFQTNLVDQRFVNTYEVASQNVIRSSMNLTKTFPKLKSTLTAGLQHSQSNERREITVNFPDAAFQTQTIYPLRNAPGKTNAWYKKWSLRYRSALRTEFIAPDSTFFTQATLDDGQYGFQHSMETNVSLNVLKYFNVSPNANVSEVYYGKSLEYMLDGNVERDTFIDPVTGQQLDSISSLGEIQRTLNPGLASYRNFSAGVSVSTQLFGKVKFRGRGLLGLKGLRHVMKPRISFGYSPDNLNGRDYISDTPYYIPESEIDPLNGRADRFLSPFADQIFSNPPRNEERIGLSYSISNLFEAKVWNRKDSTEQNVKLFQNIGVSGSYDPQDSIRWSTVRFSGGTRLFRGLTNVTLGATMDPYITRYDPQTDDFRRVDVSNLSEGRFPLSLTTFRTSISTNLTVQKIRQIFQGQEEQVVTDVNEERRKRREEETTLFEETDLLSLFERFSIQHRYNFTFEREFDDEEPDVDDRGRPVFRPIANSIELRGALQLTENWSVNIGSIGYDFVRESLTYPYLSFVRDLHCWEMRFSWAPQRNTYSFSIAVKPGTLDFINLPANQNRYEQTRLLDQ